MKVTPKWISPVNSLDNILLSMKVFHQIEKPKSQLAYQGQRCLFIFPFFCFVCLFSLQIPRLGQVCQQKQGSFSSAAGSPRPGPFPSLHACSQAFSSNLSTCQDRPTCPAGCLHPGLSIRGRRRAAEPGPQALHGGDAGENSCWVGCHCLQTLAWGCSLHRSTFCPGRPSPYISGIARANAGKDFSRESWEPVSPSCRGIELVAINLIKVPVSFDNASLRHQEKDR